MKIEHGSHDDNVDAVLKALGQARVPEGLEARVAEVLERRARAASEVKFRWREVFAGSAAAGVWWRGAVSGAAVALLLVGGLMVVGHVVRTGQSATRLAHPVALNKAAAVNVAQPQERGMLCAGPSEMRASRVTPVQVRREEQSRIEISARSIPASGPALTKQERDLVRVAHIGDLSELATLNPEVRAKLEAEEAAQFQSFFAPPAKAVSSDATTEATPTTQAVEQPAAKSADTQTLGEPTAETIPSTVGNE